MTRAPARTPRTGRPTTIGGKYRNLYLDDATFEAAKQIGGGSASEGIRRAIAAITTS